MRTPELVAPGGSFEKAKIALIYGADAVYVGGNNFGLRKSADNLSFDQLKSIVDIANGKNKKIYITLNCFPHDSDLEELPEYIFKINKVQPHALIVSDIGMCQRIKQLSDIPIHVSTQASVCSSLTAKFWQSLGVKRIVVGREVSIESAQTIIQNTGIEIESFIHGAMCVSYSGKCTISNASSGRDSNRGGCIQSCRHEYKITSPTTGKEVSAHIMNSKDLMAIKYIPEMIKSGIHAFKIEGRMKSNLYLATTVSAYRAAIDHQTNIESELKKVSNRGFCSGNLIDKAKKDSISYDWNGYSKSSELIGTVKSTDDAHMYIELKNTLNIQDNIEFLTQSGQIISLTVQEIKTLCDDDLQTANASTLIKLKLIDKVHPLSVIRRSL